MEWTVIIQLPQTHLLRTGDGIVSRCSRIATALAQSVPIGQPDNNFDVSIANTHGLVCCKLGPVGGTPENR